MRTVLSILVISLLLCSTSYARTYTRWGPFNKYVASFDSEARSRGYFLDINAIDIRFAIYVMDENVIAQCYPDSENPTVLVNRDVWNQFDEVEHEVAIFHELGHCMLAKAHDSTLKSDRHPKSIMYPNLTPLVGGSNEGYYLEHKSEYMKEFFPSIYDLFLPN